MITGMIFSALALALVVQKAPTLESQVDKIAEAEIKAETPGLAVAVVQKGKVVLLKGYGVASLESKDKVTPDTVFRLGSITKMFTAAIIQQLEREKKLNLDDAVSKYITGLPKDWQSATIRNLLQHTSGIPSYTDDRSMWKVAEKPISPEGIWRRMEKRPLDFAPGSKFKYCNTGYVMLGIIIEKLTGQSYYAQVQKRIGTPLGMRSLGEEPRANKKVLAWGYTSDRKPAMKMDMSWPFSAGALVVSMRDFLKWDAAINANTILTSAEQNQAWTPTKFTNGKSGDYGFAWVTRMEKGKLSEVAHTGGIPGFSTSYTKKLTDGTTVIVFANSDSISAASVTGKILRVYSPQTVAPALVDALPAVTERHRAVLTRIFEGKAEAKDFDDNFLKNVSVDVLNQTGAQISRGKKITGFEVLESSQQDDLVRRTYRVTVESETLKLQVAENTKLGKIVGMFISAG